MNRIINKKVVIAMSGGVDSSVAAALLKKQGYDVVGVFMQLWFPEGEIYGENRCCSLKSWHEAQAVARILDIPIYKVNFGNQFKDIIVDQFLTDYQNGKTPNPCINCNKFIKFDLLLKYVKTVFAADYLATGHYLELKEKAGVFKLFKAKDKNKDQTYFLYNLKQNQLKHLIFPLAKFNKSEIRTFAKKMNLHIHDKKDSQEICFVSTTVNDFLKKYLVLKKGKIIADTGEILGEHQGLPLYTLGQRSGIGLSGGPWYVIGLKQKSNELIVSRNTNNVLLQKKKISFKSVNWLETELNFPLTCQAQIRYRSKPEKCIVFKSGNKYYAEFAKPQRAAMPGQSIVFYNKKQLIGGGVIN